MNETQESSNNTVMSYVLGGVLVVAVVAGGFFLKPKSPAPAGGQQPEAMAPQATPTPGMITKLACDTQYYNPVIGFEKYFLSVEGGDTGAADEVTCTTKITQEGKVVATEKNTSKLMANEARGGSTFKCSTDALALKHTIPTKVDVTLADDKGASASCTAMFALPKP